MNKKQLAKNVAFSISAQIISLSVGVLLNLIVPKYTPEYVYSSWQIYILYSGYVGLLHLGLLDGIVLRYSQYDYDKINKRIIRSQFNALLVILLFFSITVSGVGIITQSGDNRSLFHLVAISIIVKNIYTFSAYSFQITNRINDYALLVIIDRIIYGVIVSLLLIVKCENFLFYCVADLVSDFIGIIICSPKNKGMYFGKIPLLKNVFEELKCNMSAGIILLIANWSSMFLVGSSKMIIQWNWDTITFGKVAFAFSLSTLLLQFVSAISIVLFPSLKRMQTNELPALYKQIRDVISVILFSMLILYYPMAAILQKWIPKYSNSVHYIGLLFPMIIFTSKVSLLTNNYFKAYRKEKHMLIINCTMMIIAFLLYFLFGSVLHNLTGVLVLTVLVLMIRSVISEIYLSKIIDLNLKFEFICELFMTFTFIIACEMFKGLYGMILYLLFLILYLEIHKKTLTPIINRANKMILNRRKIK